MKSQTEMIVASAFSLAVGLAAGIYGLWPQASPGQQPTSALAASLPSDLSACGVSVPDVSGPIPHGHGRYYDFTADWFTGGRTEAWPKYLAPFASKRVNYLEVGTFEGRSMVWMLDNVLLHPDSRATGVDIEIKPRYLQNLNRSGSCDKVRNLQGRSQDVLRNLPKASYDIIYIDGSHVTQDVMVDAVLAFDLLKPGGLLIFDDYAPLIWLWPKDIRPKQAIDAFVAGYRQHLESVIQNFQLMVRKREHICDSPTERLSAIGSYCYNWNSKQLFRTTDRVAVELSETERKMIEAYTDAAPFPEFTADLRARPEFEAMNKRLRLELQ